MFGKKIVGYKEYYSKDEPANSCSSLHNSTKNLNNGECLTLL